MKSVVVLALIATCVMVGFAKERHWQQGVWRDADVRRKLLDFGPGATSFDGGRAGTTMRAMADVRTFVIETADLRLELEDVVPIGRRSLDVTIGAPVTFAIEKNAVYVRDPDGKEHKLRITKKTARSRD